MFGNLLKLINSFGWFRMFGNTGANFVPSKHGGSKRNQKKNFKGKPKWDLVESRGNGKGLFQCRQNGERRVMMIKKPKSLGKMHQLESPSDRMSPHAFEHYFGLNYWDELNKS